MGSLACPAGFQMSPIAQVCVPECRPNYTLSIIEGIPTCVAKDEQGGVLGSYKLRSVAPTIAGAWNSAISQAYQEAVIAWRLAESNADKPRKQSAAFSNLQQAENARGTAEGETAYERARVAYYTLTKGDTWVAEEQERIANTEAQPVVDQYLARHTDLSNRIGQQKSTIDVVNGVQDKVLSVEDDLQYSVSAFQKQIKAIRNQINMDKKKQVATAEKASSWIDTFLNWIIAIVTLLAIFFVARRVFRAGPSIEQIETQARMMRAQAGLIRATKDLPPSKSWW